MNFRSVFKRICVSSCILFSIITAIYAVCLLIITVDGDGIYLEAGRTLLFFVFSILISLANEILKIKALSAATRYISHYLLFAFAVYSALFLPAELTGNRIFVGIVIFSIIYLVVMIIRSVILSRIRDAVSENEEYTEVFKKVKK